jgi:formylmethanofuran dehydrogenase subunit E
MYIPESITNEKDFKACVEFHGHTCVGVTIGYLAAKLALKQLGQDRSIDEELIAIVENDACCCDAIQLLLGCTFGKGNFFFKDHGKMAFTFGNRNTGEAVRLVLKPGIFNAPPEEEELANKIKSGKCLPQEIKEYESMYEGRGKKLFSEGPEAFFDIQKLNLEFPTKAAREESSQCSSCGEMVMRTKLAEQSGELVCKGCL